MVKQSWVSTRSRSSRVEARALQRLAPGRGAALEGDDVAPAHRQEVVDLRRRRGTPRPCFMPQRGLDVGQHEGGGAVGDQRAVGALQRAGDDRVLVGDGAAELVAQVLAQLRLGVGAAVLVVLGGDRGQRVGLVAVALEVALARSGRTRRRSRPRCPSPRRRRRQRSSVSPMAGPASSVIFSTPTTSTMRAALRLDRAQALLHRGRAGGAGVLDPGGGLEAQGRSACEHERAGEVLRRRSRR